MPVSTNPGIKRIVVRAAALLCAIACCVAASAALTDPVRKPAPPDVKGRAWVRNPIDRFILSRLEAEGLHPAPEADKRTLIRRATFDLLGLPPRPEEIRAFLADPAPDAYERLIDRLLASPHYGERWGRHWLDIARYVPGRISFTGIRHTSGDQPYRDYVVRAFNEDKPYDRFVTEQLAGDLLPPYADRVREMDRITAPAFLSIGAWFDQETDPNRLRLEMVDDMVSTTSQAFLGLTVQCARCHDHKFDPIPTADYYALAGIFRSTKIVGAFSDFWRDGRVRCLRPMAMPEEVAANAKLEQAIAAQAAGRWGYLTQRRAEAMQAWKADEPRYRAAATQLPALAYAKHFEAEDFDGVHNLRIAQLAKDGSGSDVIESMLPTDEWVKYRLSVPSDGRYRLDAFYNTAERTPLLVQVNGAAVKTDALAASTGGWDLTYQRWQEVATFDLRSGLNFLRLYAKEGTFPRIDRFRLVAVDPSRDEKIRRVAADQKLDPILLAEFQVEPEHPWPTISGIEVFLSPRQRQQIATIDAESERLAAAIQPYDLTIGVSDEAHPVDIPVHVRGDVYSVAPQPTPRGMPRLLDAALPRPAIPADHSGRLELAQWLTDPRNPLTARVMANRIWQWHFGRGIVATPSDFGTRGAPPTHPELLDELSATFVANGWSIKQMHRLIMASATYRMSCEPVAAESPRIQQRDPENKLLSHFSARRLDAEELYDAMLCAINNLPPQEATGPLNVEKSKNRAMYVLAANRAPKGMGGEIRKMFPLFDCDPSGAPIAVRTTSTTPAQSLFWLNSPLVEYYADRFAARLLKMDKLSDAKRVEMAYLIALGHAPDEVGIDRSLKFIEECTRDDGLAPEKAWSQLCQTLFAAEAFHYVR